MSEPPVVSESEDRTFQLSEDVEVRRFRGKRNGSCGQRRFTIQPGSRNARAGQEVSDGFQELNSEDT